MPLGPFRGGNTSHSLRLMWSIWVSGKQVFPVTRKLVARGQSAHPLAASCLARVPGLRDVTSSAAGGSGLGVRDPGCAIGLCLALLPDWGAAGTVPGSRTLTAWKGPWRLQQGETQRSRWRLESRWGLRPCKPVPALRGGPCRVHGDRPCGQSCLAAGQPAPSSLGGRGPENRPLGEGWEGTVTQAGVPEARAGGRSPRSTEDSWAAQTLPRDESGRGGRPPSCLRLPPPVSATCGQADP